MHDDVDTSKRTAIEMIHWKEEMVLMCKSQKILHTNIQAEWIDPKANCELMHQNCVISKMEKIDFDRFELHKSGWIIQSTRLKFSI